MTVQASAWARGIQCGSPARKLVLITIASYVAPHEGEADGFHCGYPGQKILYRDCEMSERSLRDHMTGLVEMGLIQRKKRYNADGSPTSDWIRLPVRNDRNLPAFPVPATSETGKDWPRSEVPADSAGTGGVPAESAGGTGKSEGGYRQPAAGKKKDLKERSKISSSYLLHGTEQAEEPSPPLRDEEENSFEEEPPTPKHPPMPDSPLAEERARKIADSLKWAQHPRPNENQRARLHDPIRRALAQGWTEAEVIHYAETTIAKAKDTPGMYLIRGLTEFLPDEPPTPPRTETRAYRAPIRQGDPKVDHRIDVGVDPSQVRETILAASRKLATRKRYTEEKRRPFLPDAVLERSRTHTG